ncbi:type 4a pilus biogenesis protein PilO [Vibrio europaeus]|uniref:Type 4a pilus biogenesis protein PilO n=1 Tax=Vibrio europaeus TaxID=300876 RepID=A0AAE7DXD5_9VIBR|nr:type 4a pilus biogenesis protein PilO [Vibrio europaeus]MDC5804712.1 type 4a pilus biogenesis protein PilO [Vibrio europaeus]MDC5809033.1 type 4a pilus biogenesis protein PilO [Vibrio europaeus]MDC5823955.1 type 4a pilus biogenesis protein PilO [Vibrio europaeus]MDC5829690.1 type 4a pilus biogenesis protein PilO [Vibrio europaeus]MDC5833729.1 type 4a pilus biogenesis protein PilO [Vibrio europaeus]
MYRFNLDIEEIGEWPLTYQLVVMAVLMAILQGGGYWLFAQPKLGQLDLLKQQEQQHKTSIALKTKKVVLLPRIKAQLDKLSQRYDYLSRQLPAQKELASMLASVNQVGLQNSLTFTRIDWGHKHNQAFLYKLPLNIELTGDYHDIGDFSAAIASLPRIINFDDVYWHRVSLESSTLHFRVRAYTYQLKGEVKDES